MVENFNRQVLRVAVAQICQSMGWDALQKSTHDTLTDVLQRYLEEIGKVAYSYTQLCNRTKPNLDDLHLAFQDTGIALQELENFVAQVDPVQFIQPFTTYPKCQPCRLQHPTKGEVVDRAEFYSEHLPPIPKTCEEPKDEKEEDSTAGEDAKVTSAEEIEKVKPTPLKESSNVMDSSDNMTLKRRQEGGALFTRDNKRSRLDIPANLILDKKENLENTDGESLSPATPVSPYLPQDLPKLPEDPVKPPSVTKAKTEPRQVSDVTKEIVLPLQKLTPPEKKTKTAISPVSKKPKVKKEKSVSPSVQNKLPLSNPITELLSPVKKPSSSKTSPSAKVKSPMKAKSPMVEKQKIKTSPKKCSEYKAPSLSGKSSSSKELPSKTTPTKKSPLVEQKDIGSPKVKARELIPIKKKKIVTDETDKRKSSYDSEKTGGSTSVTTPKLMIKLLPKSGEPSLSPKSSPGERKSLTTPVKVKKPSSPLSSRKISVKTKTEGESIMKDEKKAKTSSDSLEIAVLKKEHSKKKKKKKDKDKDREKSVHKEKRKSDKTDPPIPKMRFKLDPSGESKSGETKTPSSKSSTSSGHSSTKSSSRIVIETENVRSSVFIETLSNTLDYDPNRAYYCPVCHKQDDGSPMVGCDGCDEWCHWSCVGLMAAPPEDEKWYCPLCLQKRDKTKKKSKKKS